LRLGLRQTGQLAPHIRRLLGGLRRLRLFGHGLFGLRLGSTGLGSGLALRLGPPRRAAFALRRALAARLLRAHFRRLHQTAVFAILARVGHRLGRALALRTVIALRVAVAVLLAPVLLPAVLLAAVLLVAVLLAAVLLLIAILMTTILLLAPILLTAVLPTAVGIALLPAIAVLAATILAITVLAAILALLRLLARLAALLGALLVLGHLARRLAQHPRVMLGMLQEVLLGHAVIRQLGVARQHQVFVDDLLGGATHLALGSRTVEDAVNDIAERALTVRLGTRTGLG